MMKNDLVNPKVVQKWGREGDVGLLKKTKEALKNSSVVHFY
jgi:hypothetical protein